MPLNSWLPLAHPVAPTNVSALLSAVIVNLGIYGIVRTALDLAPLAGAAPGCSLSAFVSSGGPTRPSLVPAAVCAFATEE